MEKLLVIDKYDNNFLSFMTAFRNAIKISTVLLIDS